MRFGLDARLAFFDKGGIGRYIRCLAAALEGESAPDVFTVVTDFRDSGWGGNSRGVIGFRSPRCGPTCCTIPIM